MGGRPILSEGHWFWPVVFFPFAIECAHTIEFSGRGSLRGMKGSMSRATLELTVDGLAVRGRLSGITQLQIAAADITSCEVVDDGTEVVDVRFIEARWSRLARLLVSGSPPGVRDRVVLNVSSPVEWKNEIDRLGT